jgi:hypothetical protein
MLVLFTGKSRISCKFLHGYADKGQLDGECAHFKTLSPPRKSLKISPLAGPEVTFHVPGRGEGV